MQDYNFNNHKKNLAQVLGAVVYIRETVVKTESAVQHLSTCCTVDASRVDPGSGGFFNVLHQRLTFRKTIQYRWYSSNRVDMNSFPPCMCLWIMNTKELQIYRT